MNAARVADLLREIAELDARRSELGRALAEAMIEESATARGAPPRRIPPTPEPGVPIDDLTRSRARRALRRSGVAPR